MIINADFKKYTHSLSRTELITLIKLLSFILKDENLTNKYEINITFTDDKTINLINLKYRKKDMATDVLSFPMYERNELDLTDRNDPHIKILGDIVISVETAEKQAKEYGHGINREFMYLIVHSMYHLLGYDHMKKKDKKLMRKKEENALKHFNITRK